MGRIRNSLLALSPITVGSSVRCPPCSLAPSGSSRTRSVSSWRGCTYATAPSYLVNWHIQRKNGKQRAFVRVLQFSED